MSVNGSGSGDSASPAAAQSEQKDSQSADSKGSTKTSTQEAATTNPQPSSGGSAQVTAASTNKTGDHDDDKDGDDAPITDPTWKDIQSKGQRTEVSGDYVVQDSAGTFNLVGDLNSLTVQGSDVKIAAEDVDTLTVQGSKRHRLRPRHRPPHHPGLGRHRPLAGRRPRAPGPGIGQHHREAHPVRLP